MLEKFIKYYSDAKDICFRFIETLADTQLDEENNSPEIYTLTSINLTKHNCNSITVLLKEDEFGSAIMICRNLIEMYFNFDWAIEPINQGLDKDRLKEAI